MSCHPQRVTPGQSNSGHKQIHMSKLFSRIYTFYNAVICSIIMFLFCLLGVGIFQRGRLKKIVKRAGHVVGKPLDSFKTLHEKRLYRKLMQILNDPTQRTRHYFDSRRSNKKIFYFREQIQTVIKPCVYPRLCQFLIKIILSVRIH